MNKSMVIGIVLGAGVATAGGAIASYKYFKEPTHADVLSAQAIIKKQKSLVKIAMKKRLLINVK